MKVLAIQHSDDGLKCLLKADDLDSTINNALSVVQEEVRSLVEEGHFDVKLIIEVLEITEETYNAMPEFQGW